MTPYFQDLMPGNHCYGCGPDNVGGLKIKSYWANEEEAHCKFISQPQHCAAPTKFLNGGVIATLIDCHSICTAIAYAYKKADRELGQGEAIWYATANLNISYLRPTPIDSPILLIAKISGETDKIIEVECALTADEKRCATARVTAALVPSSWMAD